MFRRQTQPPTGPELVERVIAASHGRQPDGDIRAAWRDAIIDVLDAIREPSEEMLDAGEHINSELLNNNAPIGQAIYREPAKAVFREMIDVLRREIAG